MSNLSNAAWKEAGLRTHGDQGGAHLEMVRIERECHYDLIHVAYMKRCSEESCMVLSEKILTQEKKYRSLGSLKLWTRLKLLTVVRRHST